MEARRGLRIEALRVMEALRMMKALRMMEALGMIEVLGTMEKSNVGNGGWMKEREKAVVLRCNRRKNDGCDQKE